MSRTTPLFLLMFMLFSLSYTGVADPDITILDENEQPPPIAPLQITEPLENASIPFISRDEPVVEIGNDVNVFYGMVDLDNYIEGYNYSIYLADGIKEKLTNDTTVLGNYTILDKGITKNVLSEFSFKTLGHPIFNKLAPNNYTLFLVINSTNRGSLNETTFFKIIAKTGANIDLLFTPLGGNVPFEERAIFMTVNQSKQISIVLYSTGQVNAFNITLELGNINEPIGWANASLPADGVEILVPDEEIRFNFTVRPESLGIGIIELKLAYVDGQGSDKTTFHRFKVKTLPDFEARIETSEIPKVIQGRENEGFNISAFISRLDSFSFESISISFKLVSLAMTFNPEQISYSNSTSNYEFKATPVEFGFVSVQIWISIFDQVGDDLEEYEIGIPKIFEITIDTGEDNRSFSEYLPIIAIILYFILIASFAILYYREDIRAKFFTQVLGLQILESIDYRTTSVIIDGSNIAWEQTNPRRKPMINNIIRAYKALKENSFKKIVIIADAALRYQIDDRDELDRLVKSGFIKLVPAKVNADGFILRFSAENGYLILSNDLYKEFRDTYSWIDERRVPYTILDERFYLHPTFE